MVDVLHSRILTIDGTTLILWIISGADMLKYIKLIPFGNGVEGNLREGLDEKGPRYDDTPYGVMMHVTTSEQPYMACSLRVNKKLRIALPYGIVQNKNVQKPPVKYLSLILHAFWSTFVHENYPDIEYLFVQPLKAMTYLLLNLLKFADGSWIPIAVGTKDMTEIDQDDTKYTTRMELYEGYIHDKTTTGRKLKPKPRWENPDLSFITNGNVFAAVKRRRPNGIFTSPFDDTTSGEITISYNREKSVCVTIDEFRKSRWGDIEASSVYEPSFWGDPTVDKEREAYIGKPFITVRISDLVKRFKELETNVQSSASLHKSSLQLKF